MSEGSAAVACVDLTVPGHPGADVRGLGLQVDAGEVFGLFGEEEAGKTTLVRTLLGFLRPTAGVCQVLGLSPLEKPLAVRRRTGYVPAEFGVPGWMDATAAGRLLAGLQPAWDGRLYGELLELLRVPDGRPARALSTAGQTSLALSLALAHRPHVLLLDDPYGELPEEERWDHLAPVLQGARESGMAVLLACRNARRLGPLVQRAGVLWSGHLVLDAAADEIARRYQRVTLHYPGGLPTEFRLYGALRVELEADKIHLVLEGTPQDVHEQVAGLGAVQVEAQPLERGAAVEEAVAAALRAARRQEGE